MPLSPFHLAIQVRDISEAENFYRDKLGFAEGRRSANWVDFNMFGHQLVTHLNRNIGGNGKIGHATNPVDRHHVPVPHFGVVLSVGQWQAFADRVVEVIDQFVIEPCVRFQGEVGEQRTMFFLDPSGNALEFKAFADIDAQLFAV